MLLLEHGQRLDVTPALQLFACDLDDGAIRVARAGHYPDTIAADLSEERLRRFFVRDHNGYRVRRELREMVLFSTHDLLKDAPFSRMDLISCRNLLIYLNHEAQDRVLNTFHFALKPEGRLFLGTSESVDESSRLFRVLDKKNRIYARRSGLRAGLPVPTGPSCIATRDRGAEPGGGRARGPWQAVRARRGGEPSQHLQANAGSRLAGGSAFAADRAIRPSIRHCQRRS